jgi:hypothetical protein
VRCVGGARAKSFAVAASFAAAAFFGGYQATVVVDSLRLEPLLSTGTVAVVLAVFAWFRRGGETIDVAVPSFFVAYAGYIAIAAGRLAHTVVGSSYAPYFGPLADLSPFRAQWPLVLASGIPFVLFLIVVVAIPVSLIPLRPKINTQAQDVLGKFIEQQNAKGRSN